MAKCRTQRYVRRFFFETAWHIGVKRLVLIDTMKKGDKGMGIAANIVSAVVRSAVGDHFGDGLARELIGISIDGISQKGIDDISHFMDTEKSAVQYIFSEENMNAMNVPEEKREYVAAEMQELLSTINIGSETFRQCRYDSMELRDFLWNQYCEGKKGYIECEEEIRKSLSCIAKTLLELALKSENFEKEVLLQISNSADDISFEIKKLSEYTRQNYFELDVNNQTVLSILQNILEQIQKNNARENEKQEFADKNKKFKNSKTDNYIKNWNERLFLHTDNTQPPITLKDAFIMPDYEMHRAAGRIGFSNGDTLERVIEKFVDYDKTSTMLISGVPGMGKSTLVSWMADKYKEDGRVIILRFRDWESEELEKGILKAICDVLDCKRKDLESSIIILDGFDEMKALDIREKLLIDFFSALKDFDNFKCIVMSRPAYIDQSQFHNVVRLREFDISRIKKFYRVITKQELKQKEKIESNIEVLGIPVILYMAIMSHADICRNPGKPELYSRIFAQRGGIFDRFSYEGGAYGSGAQILTNQDNIKVYLTFLDDIAFKMFERNDLFLLRQECTVPYFEFEGKLINILDFPVKCLFESSAVNVEFVHKSIYEYFAAEYIYVAVGNAINEGKEKLMGELGRLFHKNIVSEEIIEFLRYKIRNDDLKNIFFVLNDVFQIMMQKGMTYYSNRGGTDLIRRELRVFTNMLAFLHMWKGKIDLTNAEYLRYNLEFKLNLREMDLSNLDLQGVYLRNADLRYADLTDTVLSRADLRGAELEGAVLSGTDLRGADLRNVTVKGTMLRKLDLRGAILDEMQVKYFEKNCNVSEIRVCIAGIGKIVSYEDYLRRGHNWL